MRALTKWEKFCAACWYPASFIASARRLSERTRTRQPCLGRRPKMQATPVPRTEAPPPVPASASLSCAATLDLLRHGGLGRHSTPQHKDAQCSCRVPGGAAQGVSVGSRCQRNRRPSRCTMSMAMRGWKSEWMKTLHTQQDHIHTRTSKHFSQHRAGSWNLPQAWYPWRTHTAPALCVVGG